MTGKKLLLAVALAAFVGWLAYLGYAVFVHRVTPPDIVSRSQLAAAPVLVVAEVTTTAGKPNPTVTVVHRLSAVGPEAGQIEVENLPDARPPSNGPFPGDGKYLLPLELAGPDGPFRVAGWPRSPGVNAYQPGQELPKPDDAKPDAPAPHVRPPLVYPWNDGVQKQLRALKYKW